MQGHRPFPPPDTPVPCPLCATARQGVMEEIRVDHLDHEYRRQLGVSVRAEFPATLDRLSLRRCENCGLEFFHPAPAGSAAFYQAIGQDRHYYSAARWEFEETLRRLPDNPDLVDVGCGDGAFLARVRGTRKRGLELNPDAVRRARALGLEVREGLLPVLPDRSADVLTMFQVLEHVTRPVEVLHETARVLRPGGRLFVAVPNNDAYIGHALHDPLNAPPHHPLRWRPQALEFVPRIAPFEVEAMLLEPLAPEHLHPYRRTMLLQALARCAGRRLPLCRVSPAMTLLRRLANLWTALSLRVAPQGPHTPGTGFSVLAVFRRREE